MRLLYTTAIRCYSLGVRLAALFGNAKAKLWVEGRKSKAIMTSESTHEPWIWFHAASLGEFEQGRPVIEAIKRDLPQYRILLSFFSPSGYEIRKDYPLADVQRLAPSSRPVKKAASEAQNAAPAGNCAPQCGQK